MTDPLERQATERRIAELPLPEPTPEFDRRMAQLLESRPAAVRSPRGGMGVLALAGGALAAGVLGLALPSAPLKRQAETTARRHEFPPVVKTIDIEISVLSDTSPGTVIEQDGLFPDGAIVVSTSSQQGEPE